MKANKKKFKFGLKTPVIVKETSALMWVCGRKHDSVNVYYLASSSDCSVVDKEVWALEDQLQDI